MEHFYNLEFRFDNLSTSEISWSARKGNDVTVSLKHSRDEGLMA